MKEIKINTVDEIIDALKTYNIIYNEDKTIKYWLYKGFILSAESDNEANTVTINDKLDLNQNFYYLEV